MRESASNPRSSPTPPARRFCAGSFLRNSRISFQTGLQGKLVLCFMFLLTSALGSACWLFASESQDVLDHVTELQAKELGRTLALAGQTALESEDKAELQRIASDLLKGGVVAAAFFDPHGNPVAVASRDPDLDRNSGTLLANPRFAVMVPQVQRERSTSLGAYVQMTTPVTRPVPGLPGMRPGTKVIGYLTLCLSQGDSNSRLRNVQALVALIGAVAVLVSLPTMYWLVHRVFLPIRQLVSATDRIAAGDLDARVAIDRSDVIGDLARSFNEMVTQVRRQKQELADANGKLASTNRQLESANLQLAEANRDLESKVRDRTAELESANARLSREISEKEDFLRTVSHDLNAPLRNIAGMTAMLLMKHKATFDADVVHRLERIQKNVEAETDLIGELLELSRIKTRRQRMEAVNLAQLVTEVGELFTQDLESRQIQLRIDTPLPLLVCERARFRQVFQNLIDNAIKYMGEGSVPASEPGTESPAVADAGRVKEIHIGCRLNARGPEFFVRDTGMGIEPDDIDKVFCVFRRGRGQAVQGVSGKGVGLACVKSIIEMYDGSIWVESRVGQGSTFRFTIDGKHVAPPGGVTPPGPEVSRAA